MKKKSGTPSAYRAIIRDLKSGGERRDAERRLKKLPDPYYTSLGLMEIASLERKERAELARQSLTHAARVDRGWRRAELLGMLCRKVKGWPEGKDKDEIRDGITDILKDIPEGDPMSEAVKGCSSLLCTGDVGQIFGIAAGNSLKDAKQVIKTALEAGQGPEKLAGLIRNMEKRDSAELLGYLHMQSVKQGRPERFMEEAVKYAAGVTEDGRVEVFRYLVKQAGSIDDLKLIESGAEGLPLPERARILGGIAGRADRLGDRDAARKLFDELEAMLSSMEGVERAAISVNLAEGLGRLGEKERAAGILRGIEEEAKGNPGILKKLCSAMKKLGMESEICIGRHTDRTEKTERSGIALALFNTYEGGGSTTHLRAIARAAPLCMAYGLDLVLVDFPYKQMEKTVEKVIKETNIGRGGKYLRQMLNDGRIRLAGHDELLRSGICIATTSRPDAKKSIDMAEAVGISKKRSVCIVMGLGKHGLPPEFLKDAPHHMELTGQNIPLETCTVMGIIAEKVAHT